MTDDLRERYHEALTRSLSSPKRGFADHLDAVMAVRDEELESARAAAQAELRGGLDCAQLAVQWQERAEQAEAALTLSNEECKAVGADREAAEARASQAEDTLARVRAFAGAMRSWCSPYGVATNYAVRLLQLLDNPPDAGEPTPTTSEGRDT